MGSPLASTVADPYRVLGLTAAASGAEIKAAYRALVKQHHPDAGGDQERIIALNAAWELLRDGERRRAYDLRYSRAPGPSQGPAGVRAPSRARSGQARAADEELSLWMQQVVAPIDRLLAQVINPFPAQLRELSADPYDDSLMEAFCAFLSSSQAKLDKVESLYRSRACPAGAQTFALNLYHCLSQVQDALRDLERYTMGYVDSYLRDGRELLREAKRLRSQLLAERRQLEL
ncbi:MAG: J domain-containing protein [Cyanobacteria bacterium]|nr:J domain-containing protein [Cyanobacteriota bacterium]